MNGPFNKRPSLPTERLAHFADRKPRPTAAQAFAAGLRIDPASRDAGLEDARAGRPPSPAPYDDLSYFLGYASGKGWRR